MLGITISLLGPSLSALAQRTGVTLSQAGIFFTLFSAGSVTATLFVARHNDRPTRHVLLIGGALLMGASFWLIAASRTFIQAAAAVALSGMALSTVGTAPNAIIADLVRKPDGLRHAARAGQALNALHVVAGIGSFIGPLLVGAAIRAGSDYRAAYKLAAAAMLLVCVLWILSKPPRPHSAGGSWHPEGVVAPLILVLVLAMLYTGTEQVLGGWLSTYGQKAVALGPATASLLVSLFWLAILCGRLAAVRILRRMTSRVLLKTCVLVGGAGIVVILLGQAAPALAWIGVALAGLGFGPVFPTALALSNELAPGHAGAAGSLVVASGSVGAMILPWTAGALMPQIGVGGSIAAALLPLAAMLACLWAIARAGDRP